MENSDTYNLRFELSTGPLFIYMNVYWFAWYIVCKRAHYGSLAFLARRVRPGPPPIFILLYNPSSLAPNPCEIPELLTTLFL